MMTRMGAKAMLRMIGKGIERIEMRTFVIKFLDCERSVVLAVLAVLAVLVEFMRGS